MLCLWKRLVNNVKQVHPLITVLENVRDGDFGIVNYAIHPRFGFYQASGPILWLDRNAMRAHGLNDVLANLRAFSTRRLEPTEAAAGRTAVERRRFDREHKHLTVTQPDPDVLVLAPGRRQEGGFVGRKEDEIVISLPCAPLLFYEAVVKAFSVCD